MRLAHVSGVVYEQIGCQEMELVFIGCLQEIYSVLSACVRCGYRLLSCQTLVSKKRSVCSTRKSRLHSQDLLRASEKTPSISSPFATSMCWFRENDWKY